MLRKTTLIGCDLSQIEARATGWLAGDEKFLDLFRTGDPYCTWGKTIFGREITKKDDPKERNASKANVLSMGFAGGIGAQQRAAESYGVDLAYVASLILPTATISEIVEGERLYAYYLEKAEEQEGVAKLLNRDEGVACDILKQRYRADFPAIVRYWDVLEQAFLQGGNAGRITVEVKSAGLRVLTLPSGRQLFYHGVFSHPSGKYGYQARKGRKMLWKGTLIENGAQAVNDDVSNWYKARANQIAPVIFHCYDEFMMEVEASRADEAMFRLQMLTQERPPFADGLPLGFEFWQGDRYGK